MIFPLIRLLLFYISRTRLLIFWNIKAYFVLVFLVLKAPLDDFQIILNVTQSPSRVTILIRSFKFHSDKMYFFLHSGLIFVFVKVVVRNSPVIVEERVVVRERRPRVTMSFILIFWKIDYWKAKGWCVVITHER